MIGDLTGRASSRSGDRRAGCAADAYEDVGRPRTWFVHGRRLQRVAIVPDLEDILTTHHGGLAQAGGQDRRRHLRLRPSPRRRGEIAGRPGRTSRSAARHRIDRGAVRRRSADAAWDRLAAAPAVPVHPALTISAYPDRGMPRLQPAADIRHMRKIVLGGSLVLLFALMCVPTSVARAPQVSFQAHRPRLPGTAHDVARLGFARERFVPAFDQVQGRSSAATGQEIRHTRTSFLDRAHPARPGRCQRQRSAVRASLQGPRSTSSGPSRRRR